MRCPINFRRVLNAGARDSKYTWRERRAHSYSRCSSRVLRVSHVAFISISGVRLIELQHLPPRKQNTLLHSFLMFSWLMKMLRKNGRKFTYLVGECVSWPRMCKVGVVWLDFLLLLWLRICHMKSRRKASQSTNQEIALRTMLAQNLENNENGKLSPLSNAITSHNYFIAST